jgi:hypothetical protein
MRVSAPLLRRAVAASAVTGVLGVTMLFPFAGPGSEPAPGPLFAMQLNGPAADYDSHPPCLCPVCTSFRERGMDIPQDLHQVTPGYAIV